MSIRNYSNTTIPQTLTSDINDSSGTTAIPVGSTATYPTPPFILGLERGTPNQEVCLCTAKPNSTTFTVVRGYDGTSPVAHNTGATVEHTSAALDYSEPNVFINLLEEVGDIIVLGGSGPINFGTGGAGADGYSLTADHTQANGIKWAQTIAPGITAFTAATSPPTGWLQANGGAVSRTTYAALFSAIGTTYGSGNGSTTFNLPNLGGRFPLGVNGSYPLASTGGAATHEMSTGEMPSHSHDFDINENPNQYEVAAYYPSSLINFVDVAQGSNTKPLTWTNPSIGSTGGGEAFSLLNPYQVLTPIIKF